MDRNAPIGVFDSGVGGLTVMREIMRQMPDERIVYFGDTARVPYGNKSKETVIRYSQQIIRFLQTKEVKAIVIACNTASACALEAVEKYGAWKGGWLALRRVLRCNPFHRQKSIQYDPVP